MLGELGDELNCALASYKGSLKKFLVEIATALDIPTTNENGKSLTADALKEEIAENVGDSTLLIIPESQRLPSSIRYWLEALLDNEVLLVCFAVANPRKDLFLNLIEIELSLPSDLDIREAMQQEAQRLGLKLSRSRMSQLQSQAGRNLMLARKVVQTEALGINDSKPEHTQYIDISPLLIGGLTLLGIVRFVGIGTGNKGLYVIGGMALILVMTLRQLSRVRGSSKKLGE